MIAMIALLLTLQAQEPSQVGAALAQAKPTVGAYFASQPALLAFGIECRNSSEQGVDRYNLDWLQAYRVDSALPPPTGSAGSIAGPHSPVPAGATWRGILVFVPLGTATPTVRPGADAMLTVSRQLPPGRHTIAVQCFGVWSDDLVFFWDPKEPG